MSPSRWSSDHDAPPSPPGTPRDPTAATGPPWPRLAAPGEPMPAPAGPLADRGWDRARRRIDRRDGGPARRLQRPRQAWPLGTC